MPLCLMSKNLYHKLWPRRGLKATSIRLQTYSKKPIPVPGTADVKVAYEGQTATLPLVVVKQQGPTLLGRNWLSQIQLNWSKIHYNTSPVLPYLFSKYSEVFQEVSGISRGARQRLMWTPLLHPVSTRPVLCLILCVSQ